MPLLSLPAIRDRMALIVRRLRDVSKVSLPVGRGSSAIKAVRCSGGKPRDIDVQQKAQACKGLSGRKFMRQSNEAVQNRHSRRLESNTIWRSRQSHVWAAASCVPGRSASRWRRAMSELQQAARRKEVQCS